MTGGSSGAAKPAVSQRDLGQFLDLQRQLSSLKGRYTLARRRLLRLVDGHAPVEPGPLRVEVQESARQQITKAFLVSVLGEAGYECMRIEAPPTIYLRLVVRERARESSSMFGQGAKAHGWTVFVKKELT